MIHLLNHYFVALFDYARSTVVVYGRDRAKAGYRLDKVNWGAWSGTVLWKHIAAIFGFTYCSAANVKVEHWDFYQVSGSENHHRTFHLILLDRMGEIVAPTLLMLYSSCSTTVPAMAPMEYPKLLYYPVHISSAGI